MLKISEHRKQSFRTSWRYHKIEVALCAFAIVFYLLLTKDAKPSLATAVFYYGANVVPFFVVARILHSGFTGRFNEKYQLKNKGKHNVK